MKKLKLFPKIFFYTFLVMLLVTVLAHLLLYLLAPQMTLSTNHFTEGNTVIENTANTEALIRAAILNAFPFSMIGCIAISAGCSFLFSKAMVKPIQQISKTTEQMEKLNKAARCPINSSDEIGALAVRINRLYLGLLSTIENLEEEKRKVSETQKLKLDFLRAASHELKTPVTALNAILENMILGVGKYKDRDTCLLECKEITQQLSSMIKEILDTSRLDFLQMQKKADKLDLSEHLLKICGPYQALAKTKQVVFDLKIQDSCFACVSFRNLEKILSNLLLNAVSYTKPGQRVSVILYGNRICITNECTPIPEEKIKRLFEPFYRPDFARSRSDGGNGLGLYIVDAMSNALDLAYTFEAVTNPPGMCFTLFFS